MTTRSTTQTLWTLLSIASATFTFALPTCAQDSRPIPTVANGSYAGITVNGHCDLIEKPDVAFVSLSVITQSPDEVTAVQDNATKTTALMAVLGKSEILPKDIHTEYYTVQPVYDYTANPPVQTGFTATNSIRVTIHDITKAGLILDKAIQAGATSADGLTFDLADKNKAQGEALIAAVANARSKADLIAGAAGITVGRVLAISESGSASPPVYPQFRMMAAKAEGAPTTPVSPADITVTADVTATYAIGYTP